MLAATVVRYEGPLSGAYELVEDLQAAGLTVEWTPPPEERTGAVEAVVIAILARGAYDVLLLVIERVRSRLASDATISTDVDEDAE